MTEPTFSHELNYEPRNGLDVFHENFDFNKPYKNNRDKKTIFHLYVLSHRIKEIVEKGLFDLNTKDQRGDTALHYGNTPDNEGLEFFIKHGFDLNNKNNYGDTIFHIIQKYSSYLDYAYENGFDIFALNNHNKTIFHKNPKCIKFIDKALELGLNINLIDLDGNNIYNYVPVNSWDNQYNKSLEHLETSIKYGLNLNHRNNKNISFLEQIKVSHLKNYFPMILENGFNVNSVNNKGNTIFHHYLMLGQLKLAVEYGFDVNKKNYKNETIIYGGYYLTVNDLEFLLENGFTEFNNKTNNGKTFFHDTNIEYIDYDILKFFINNGFDINSIDNYGNTIFHNKQFTKEVLELAVSSGFKINTVNEKGESIFHTFKKYIIDDRDKENIEDLSYWEIAKIIEKNADDEKDDYYDYIDIGDSQSVDDDYYTRPNVFMYVIQNEINTNFTHDNGNKIYDSIAVIKFNKALECALENGFDPNIKNNKGNTVFHYYFWLTNKLLKLAISKGLDINITNEKEDTIFHHHMWSIENMETAIDNGFDCTAENDNCHYAFDFKSSHKTIPLIIKAMKKHNCALNYLMNKKKNFIFTYMGNKIFSNELLKFAVEYEYEFGDKDLYLHECGIDDSIFEKALENGYPINGLYKGYRFLDYKNNWSLTKIKILKN